MNRRQLIKGIGAALCAGAMPPFLPSLLPQAVAPQLTGAITAEHFRKVLEDVKRQAGKSRYQYQTAIMTEDTYQQLTGVNYF